MAPNPEDTVVDLMGALEQSVRDAKADRQQRGTVAPLDLAPLDADRREAVITEEVTAAYYQGLRDGVTRYARWDHGVQVVGTGQFTLDQALARIDAAEAAGEWSP